jgi:hypothetical protein
MSPYCPIYLLGNVQAAQVAAPAAPETTKFVYKGQINQTRKVLDGE